MSIQETIYAHELGKLNQAIWQLYMKSSRDEYISEQSRDIVTAALEGCTNNLNQAIKHLRA